VVWKKPIEVELSSDELLSVEGGIDTDSDEDDCSRKQCQSQAVTSCYSNHG